MTRKRKHIAAVGGHSYELRHQRVCCKILQLVGHAVEVVVVPPCRTELHLAHNPILRIGSCKHCQSGIVCRIQGKQSCLRKFTLHILRIQERAKALYVACISYRSISAGWSCKRTQTRTGETLCTNMKEHRPTTA